MFNEFSRLAQICQGPTDLKDALRYLRPVIRHPSSQWMFGVQLLRWSYDVDLEMLLVCVSFVTTHEDMEGSGNSAPFVRGVLDLKAKVCAVRDCQNPDEAKDQIALYPVLASFFRGFEIDDQYWRYS